MEFTIETIKELRKRLKDCYAFKYKDDKKRLGYLKSTRTSESNPFLQVLSKDLQERFDENEELDTDQTSKKNTGNSTSTLKNIFFNNDKVNYDGDTISNLELYCSEVEQEIQKSKEEEKPTKKVSIKPKKKSYRWLYIPLFIAGLLFVIYIVLSNMGERVMDGIDEIMGENLKGEFDPDPAGIGTGFLSIHENHGDDLANVYDDLIFIKTNKGERFMFTVYLDFRNKGLVDIKDAVAKLHFNDTITQEIAIISAELTAPDVASIYDTTTISNISDTLVLKLERAYVENSHTAPNCEGYKHKIDLSQEELKTKTVSLDVLDTYENGWCDQGYVVFDISIENISK